MDHTFFMNTKINIGKGCVKESSALFSALGRRCLIVTGSSSAKKCGALDDIISVLEKEGITYKIFDKITQNPTVLSCREGGILASSFNADFIIGIGGGSPLDGAKAISVFASNQELSEEDFYSLKWNTKPLPVIAIGTTSGTGSEVTAVAVITDSKGLKKSIRHDSIYPVLALGDPSYTMTLSDDFTRCTASDAMAHCMESYFNKTANEFSRTFAVRGMKLLMPVFETIASYGTEGLDYKDREELYLGSIFGGLAISVTGTAFPHALGYFLTENYGIPHGTACAKYLPAFILHNQKNAPTIYAELFEELVRTPDEVRTLIEDITPSFELTLNEKDLSNLMPRWENNKSLKKSFGNVDGEYVTEILRALFK
ncbi:MAG: iron-containing alcohol dehydrogenase family protein [Bacillota bacterium]|nr:iron-containing alcohol dehydrogenase family protein [Bacillota bacterium]